MPKGTEIGDLKTMVAQIRISVYIIMAVSLLVGCAYQRNVTLPPVGLPEGIFSIPQSNNYGAASVAVFSFSAPSNAQGKGEVAALFLCQELEQKGVFREIISLPDINDMTMRNLINHARIKRYDLIIVGKLLYYFEGSLLEPSSVKEEIRVIKVRGGKTADPLVRKRNGNSAAGSFNRLFRRTRERGACGVDRRTHEKKR